MAESTMRGMFASLRVRARELRCSKRSKRRCRHVCLAPSVRVQNDEALRPFESTMQVHGSSLLRVVQHGAMTRHATCLWQIVAPCAKAPARHHLCKAFH